MCNQQSLRSACAYAPSDQSLCQLLEYFMSVKLLAEHHLEFLSLKGDCTGFSESTLVKISHSWKSHIVSEYDQEIPQSQTADKSWHRCQGSYVKRASFELHNDVFRTSSKLRPESTVTFLLFTSLACQSLHCSKMG